MAVPIMLFYILGVLMFVFGIEEQQQPKNFIYAGLAFFINMMGYYISYNDPDFVTTAYLPLVLMIISILYLIFKGFQAISSQFNDNYKTDED